MGLLRRVCVCGGVFLARRCAARRVASGRPFFEAEAHIERRHSLLVPDLLTSGPAAQYMSRLGRSTTSPAACKRSAHFPSRCRAKNWRQFASTDMLLKLSVL